MEDLMVEDLMVEDLMVGDLKLAYIQHLTVGDKALGNVINVL